MVIADVLRGRGGLVVRLERRARNGPRRPARRRSGRSRGHGAEAPPRRSRSAPNEHRDYYLGYSNSVLWPVFHNRLDLARFDAGFYQRYVEVNQRFAEALAPLLLERRHVWVHDYHLIPLAAELRKRGVSKPDRIFPAYPGAPAADLSCHPGAPRARARPQRLRPHRAADERRRREPHQVPRGQRGGPHTPGRAHSVFDRAARDRELPGRHQSR